MQAVSRFGRTAQGRKRTEDAGDQLAFLVPPARRVGHKLATEADMHPVKIRRRRSEMSGRVRTIQHRNTLEID